jgi:hypothetical protein
MPVCSAAFRTTGAGSATLPIASIYGVTTTDTVRVLEIGVFNSTVTACQIQLRRVSTTGTQGAAQTEVCEESLTYVPLAQVFDTHTVAPTLVAGIIRSASLGAAIGSGVIWTFKGIAIDKLTTSGLAIIPVGTGQICDIHISWYE